MKKLLCLHGFLGHPRDFNFLKNDFEVFAPNLAQYVSLDFDYLLKKISEEISLAEYHILGYSFGARLGARIFRAINDNRTKKQDKKLVCLAGHLGIKDEDKRLLRKKQEDMFLEKIASLNEADFLHYWNNLALFKNDQGLSSINYKNAKYYFENYGLSQQPYLKDVLLKSKKRVCFFYGAADEKYAAYAKQDLAEFAVSFVPNCGHRLIDKKNFLLKKLLEIL